MKRTKGNGINGRCGGWGVYFWRKATGAHWRGCLFVVEGWEQLFGFEERKDNVLFAGWPYKKCDKNKRRKGWHGAGK